MTSLLCLAPTEPDGSLARPALEALNAATRIAAAWPDTPLIVGLIGPNPAAAATRIAGCGAARVLAVTGDDFAVSRYATDAAGAEALARAAQAEIIVAPGTLRLNRCLPGVAARLKGRADTHVTAVETGAGTIAVHRWYYRQRMEGVLSRTQRPWFILLEPGSEPAWVSSTPTSASAPTVESVVVPVPDAARRTTVEGIQEPTANTQTIRPEADLLLVAGAGWTKKQSDGQTHLPDAERLILGFLRLTRASLGSSKSLVDLGGEGQPILPFLTHLNQIGQTGATPRHRKGLSTCCHGEEPHTVGWRFVAERRAISLDPNCGWSRGKADVLYVADAFQVVARVNALLERTCSST